MKNIGNNIFDNLKQMRRPYVAPAMLVEEVVEEFVLQTNSTKVEGTGEDTERDETSDGDMEFSKETNLFWGDDYIEE